MVSDHETEIFNTAFVIDDNSRCVSFGHRQIFAMRIATDDVCYAALMTNTSVDVGPGDIRISIESVQNNTSITDRVLF